MPPGALLARRAGAAASLLLAGPVLLVASVPGAEEGTSTGGLRVSLAAEDGASGGAHAPVLVPGVPVPLDLRVANPYGVVVEVTALSVRVGGVRPHAVAGCAPADFVASDAALRGLVVPARGSTTLSAAGVPSASWPQVSMPATTADADACRGLEVTLDFRARGRFR